VRPNILYLHSHDTGRYVEPDGHADASCTPIVMDLRNRLERWMKETGDPLLEGPVPPPPGAEFQRPRPGLARRADSHRGSVEERELSRGEAES
jgi:hypothetical protein